MRVWTCQPCELDCLRRVAQYREIDMILWSLERSRSAAQRKGFPLYPVGGFVTKPWSSPIGMYHLVTLYTFLAPQPMALTEKHPTLEDEIMTVAKQYSNEQFHLQRDAWPSRELVSEAWTLADLMDLQTRWRTRVQTFGAVGYFNESSALCLAASIARHGDFSQRGRLKGSQTLATEVSEEDLEKWRKHQHDYPAA